jgi:CDP-glucose 4,6-dehydratase
MFLAERMAQDPTQLGEAFNFSNETQVTALELVGKILAIMDRGDLEPRVLNEASNEIPCQYLSAKKARERLGWKPLFTLEEGLKRTVAWYREFFEREKDA